MIRTLGIIFFCLTAFTVQARETWQCGLAGVAELVFPGAGYAVMGQWDKAIAFGGTRHILLYQYFLNARQPDFQQKTDEIYHTDSDGATTIHWHRSSFYGNSAAQMYQNLTFTTIYDLYDEKCEPNPKTYQTFLAPYRVDHFGKNPAFWLPLGYLAVSMNLPSDSETRYTTHNDLKRQEMMAVSYVNYQLVGVGEELLFRGVVQRSFYNLFSTWLSPQRARWSAIVAGAGVFGLAHNGEGGSALPAVAFVGGMYLGWLYHHSDGSFDITTPIALHSWWDTLLVEESLASSRFKKIGAIPSLYSRQIPLFAWQASW